MFEKDCNEKSQELVDYEKKLKAQAEQDDDAPSNNDEKSDGP